MKTFSLIKKNAYFDSVTLMGVSKKLSEIAGVLGISVSMGTELNQALLHDSGMNTPETDLATPNDLMIVFQINDATDQNAVSDAIEIALNNRAKTSSTQANPAGIKSAINILPEANLAVISLPGEYAAFEARKALSNGLHVMMFSDNVSIEDELALKTMAHEKGLLMMGPDCGTAIINQKSLCFSNVVGKGRVGIIGASGTGTQEITVLLDQYNQGISQVIGTGGRDLSESIGAIMMCDAIDALADDSETELIVLVSKPPSNSVAKKVYEKAKTASKPIVACFLNQGKSADNDGNIHFASTLEEGARKAISIINPGIKINEEPINISLVSSAAEPLNHQQKYLRGVFCGGTLAEEARIVFKNCNDQATCFSNTTKVVSERLNDPRLSQEHCVVDMGDDAFTVGKPHPMIDPSTRSQRFIQEAADPATAVILFDIVLGFGSHPDPATVALDAIELAREAARAQGREIAFVAYVLGTDRDPQHLQSQAEKLRSAGVILGKTNAHAARIAAGIIKEISNV